MDEDFRLDCTERWLDVHFAQPQEVLSWAVVGGGRRRARSVVWHYVRREELPEDVDPVALLSLRLEARGLQDAVGLLTARDLLPHADVTREQQGLRARCVATVGLGNALRTGDRAGHSSIPGTINVLCHLSAPLSELAMLEAMALVVEARTAALLDQRFPSVVSGKPASGTGTDCCVVAAPGGADCLPYTGKHTLAGQLIGDAVESAVSQATHGWLSEQR